MTHEQILALLSAHVIPFGTEAVMQETIARILHTGGVEFTREVALSPRDRIDFTAGRIGIECKVAGGRANVLEQLLRYAGSSAIDSLILVTSRRGHRFTTTEIGGKSLSVVWVAVHL